MNDTSDTSVLKVKTNDCSFDNNNVRSREYDDIFFQKDGIDESKYVFFDQNNIQEKFNPVITSDMKIFSFFQMLSIIFVSGSVLLFSQSLAYVDIAMFGALMVLFSTLNSRLLENKNYSYALLLLFSILLLIRIYN